MNSSKRILFISLLMTASFGAGVLQSTSAQSAPQYVTESERVKDLKEIATLIAGLQNRVTFLENCVRKGLYVHGQYASC